MPKILVIDDDRNLQKLVKVNLANRGYAVLFAPDGENGLELTQLERPDLILLDLMLPGISGVDVLITLKADQELRKIPVFILTASGHKDEENKVRNMGATDYLTKPFGIDELLRKVEQVLGEWE